MLMNKKITIIAVVILTFLVILFFVKYRYQSFSEAFLSKETTGSISTDVNIVNEASQDLVKSIAWSTSTETNNFSLTSDEITKDSHYYKVGLFISGPYQGSDLIIATIPCQEMCFKDDIYYLVKSVGTTTLLASHSVEVYEGSYLNRDKFVIDASTTIPELFFPENIVHEGKSFTLESGNNQNSFFNDLYKPSDIKYVFTHPIIGDVYTDSKIDRTENDRMVQNGFYVRALDGTIRVYSLDYNFYDKNHSMPIVVWNNGATNTVEYTGTDRGGCGSHNFASVASSLDAEDLQVTGKTSFGDSIYELKNVQHEILNRVYDIDYNPSSYSVSENPSENAKMSYGKFVQSHPVFFWYDSFGRLIKFQRSDFIPQAECGKPVIYLYPETTTEVSVQVAPKGGFTKTEPEYGNGWKVIATPNSELTEVSSNKKYPYLFWEGRGGIYETPKKGFVVKQTDVHNFLVEKLTMLGLNKKEQFDFMEFWEPKMTDSPYYFVTFLGTSDMDKIAPLTISPKPDTVIRILMDYTPLSYPIEVEGYNIRTPGRKGFTVVEWGGVLR